jgi:hypothetical protein
MNADEKDLTTAYGIFSSEAKNLSQNYAPKTINTDGWCPTNMALKKLFPSVVLILCFLHAFLKIRKTVRRS